MINKTQTTKPEVTSSSSAHRGRPQPSPITSFRRGQIWQTKSGIERTITSINEGAAALWYQGGKTGTYQGCCNFSSFQTWVRKSSAVIVDSADA